MDPYLHTAIALGCLFIVSKVSTFWSKRRQVQQARLMWELGMTAGGEALKKILVEQGFPAQEIDDALDRWYVKQLNSKVEEK
jgi:hypothetical protein